MTGRKPAQFGSLVERDQVFWPRPVTFPPLLAANHEASGNR